MASHREKIPMEMDYETRGKLPPIERRVYIRGALVKPRSTDSK